MQPTDLVTLNMRELDRLKVIQAVVDRMLKPGLAAERLHLTVRQVERLVLRYKQAGAAGVGSAARGRPGNRKLDEATAYRALILIRDRYADFGPTLACEKLRECHGLTLSKETVRHLMTDAGLWIPRKQRPPKIHQPRNRRSCLGELIQIDGSDHRWFEDRAPACTLLLDIGSLWRRMAMIVFAPAMLRPSLLMIYTGSRRVPVVALRRPGRPACVAFIAAWRPRRMSAIRLRLRMPITGTRTRRCMIDPSPLIVIPRLPVIIAAPVSAQGERDDR